MLSCKDLNRQPVHSISVPRSNQYFTSVDFDDCILVGEENQPQHQHHQQQPQHQRQRYQQNNQHQQAEHRNLRSGPLSSTTNNNPMVYKDKVEQRQEGPETESPIKRTRSLEGKHRLNVQSMSRCKFICFYYCSLFFVLCSLFFYLPYLHLHHLHSPCLLMLWVIVNCHINIV